MASKYRYNGLCGLKAISKHCGKSYHTLWRFINEKGMTLEEAVAAPLDNRGRASTKPGSKQKSKRELLTEGVLRGVW